MTDADPPADAEADTGSPTAADDVATDHGRPGRPRLDGRTIGICVCIALLMSLLAALVTMQFVGDDDNSKAGSDSDKVSLSTGRIDGDELLSVEVLTVDGTKTTLRDQLGDKPILVNLWAQSCVPCVKEMPLLEQVHQDDDRVEVIGVNTQDQLRLARDLADQTGITYPWLRDPDGNFLYASKASGLPRTVLLSRTGRPLAAKTGEFDSVDEITSWLDAELD